MPDTNPQQRDLIREYLLYLRVEKGLAKNSIEAYGRDLEKLRAWAEKTGLDLISLTKKDLREWLMDTGRQKLSETSRQRLNSSVRGFYKFLAMDGHISKNPAEDLTSPKKGSYLPKFLNQAEIERLLTAPDVSQESGLRDRAILELMYACGLRVSEVVNMRTSDVDLDAGIATFTGKGSKTRRVPVGSSAVDWLRAYLAQRSKIKDLAVSNLFVTPLGRPLDRQAVYLIVRGYAEQCGFTDVSPHTIRHSFATHLVQNRADIRSVQMMLGHSDISTTQIYTHMTDTHLRKSYEKFHPRSKANTRKD